MTEDSFELGPYTVRIAVRPDNPLWPQYLVFLAGVLIGRHFSRPDRGCCDWLAAQRAAGRTVYANPSAKPKTHPMRNYPQRIRDYAEES